MWEKPRQSTNCRIHYGRGVQQREYTEAITSCPLLHHTRWLQLRQRPHSLSLSLSQYTRAIQLLLTKVQQLTIMLFALCHIYTHMTFGLFTHMALKGSRENIFTYVPLLIGRTNHHRVFGHPVLSNFPPGGTCFPTTIMSPLCILAFSMGHRIIFYDT